MSASSTQPKPRTHPRPRALITTPVHLRTVLAAIKLPGEIAQKARYTVTILRDAPNPAGAERFVSFLLGSPGRDLLTQHGLELLKPDLSGDREAVPAAINSLVEAAQ